MKLSLIRIERSPSGTLGALMLDGMAFCCTLELPWVGNQVGVSCIPTGRYVLKRTASPLVEKITGGTWKHAFEVTGVPGRSRVLIHPGNTVSDTRGCILIGRTWGKLRGDRAVLNSGDTFNEFMTVTRNIDAMPITVTEAVI
jgi:hypothetical protein